MTSVIITVVMLLIVVLIISKIIKKIRGIRASFRDTFGGGRQQTAENAASMMMDNKKDNNVPSWAVDAAAAELTKYALANDSIEAHAKLHKILDGYNMKMIDLPKYMAIEKHSSKEEAEAAVAAFLRDLNAKKYMANKQLSDKDEKLIRYCTVSYYFAVDGVSYQQAKDAVDYLVDKWKMDVEDGNIG